VDWSTVIPVLIGGGITIAASERTSRWQSRRERKKWKAEREASRADRRDQFELDALIRLQDVLGDLARLNFIFGGRLAGQYVESDLSGAEVSQRVGTGNLELNKVRARILDADVSRGVTQFLDGTTRTALSATPDEAKAGLEAAADAYMGCQTAIAEAIARIHSTSSRS